MEFRLEHANICVRDIEPMMHFLKTAFPEFRMRGEGKEGFSPKDYEERPIPIPEELAERLAKLSRNSEWVFPNKKASA